MPYMPPKQPAHETRVLEYILPGGKAPGAAPSLPFPPLPLELGGPRRAARRLPVVWGNAPGRRPVSAHLSSGQRPSPEAPYQVGRAGEGPSKGQGLQDVGTPLAKPGTRAAAPRPSRPQPTLLSPTDPDPSQPKIQNGFQLLRF